jgi:uncharacterized protein YndB with AHSA1/START domain
MTEDLGAVRTEDDRIGLRYERSYDASPNEVWAALTEPESIRRWLLADATLEHRVGGVFRLDWSGEEQAEGEVRVWEPPRVLEVDWLEPDVRSVLRIEVAPSGAGALLVLDHRDVTHAAALGMGAGWHAHLELLRELLEGGAPDAESWEPRYKSLRPEYEQLLAARSAH